MKHCKLCNYCKFTIFTIYTIFAISQFSQFRAILSLYFVNLGEHPAAMQRGAANTNIDLSIVVYIVTLSMLLQQLNRITHGYGVSYDVIRWLNSIWPKTMASPSHCQYHQHQHQHQHSSDCIRSNSVDQYPYQMLDAGENQHSTNNESVRCIMRWKPPPTMDFW